MKCPPPPAPLAHVFGLAPRRWYHFGKMWNFYEMVDFWGTRVIRASLKVLKSCPTSYCSQVPDYWYIITSHLMFRAFHKLYSLELWAISCFLPGVFSQQGKSNWYRQLHKRGSKSKDTQTSLTHSWGNNFSLIHSEPLFLSTFFMVFIFSLLLFIIVVVVLLTF